MFIVVREVQYENADCPMKVTESGIVTLVSEEQFSNRYPRISVILFGSETVVSLVQSENASPLMCVTESGIVIDVSEVQ